MGPVWQNPISTVRTDSVHNTTQNSSDNLPSYLQTNIIAQLLSIGGEGVYDSGGNGHLVTIMGCVIHQLHILRSVDTITQQLNNNSILNARPWKRQCMHYIQMNLSLQYARYVTMHKK